MPRKFSCRCSEVSSAQSKMPSRTLLKIALACCWYLLMTGWMSGILYSICGMASAIGLMGWSCGSLPLFCIRTSCSGVMFCRNSRFSRRLASSVLIWAISSGDCDTNFFCSRLEICLCRSPRSPVAASTVKFCPCSSSIMALVCATASSCIRVASA